MRSFFSFLLIVSICLSLTANPLPVKLTKPDTLYIGQNFSIEVNIPHASDRKIIPPHHIFAENVDLIDVKILDSQKFHTYLITVAAFDTGKVEIPPISFYVNKINQSSTLDSMQTQPFSVWVSSSLAPADTTLRDINPPESVFLEWQDYLILLIILNVISLIYILLKNLKNRKSKEVISEVIDDRPPWIKALEMLQELKSQSLLENNEWVEYHYNLSLILRFFLLHQFNIKAIEMTTYEIKESLPPDFNKRSEILHLLSFCDQIKFAKSVPEIIISKKYEEWLENYLLSFKIDDSETEV